MEIYKLKWTVVQTEIFRLLCLNSGEKLSQNKIAKLLSISPTSVNKAIKKLEKDDIVKINKNNELNIKLIELNRENWKVINLKKVENLKMFYELGLAETLIENYPGTTIILFGSYSRGEDTKDSDIDIAVIGTNQKPKIIKFLNKEVRINTFKSFEDIDKNLKTNIFNGIVIFGSIEL